MGSDGVALKLGMFFAIEHTVGVTGTGVRIVTLSPKGLNKPPCIMELDRHCSNSSALRGR